MENFCYLLKWFLSFLFAFLYFLFLFFVLSLAAASTAVFIRFWFWNFYLFILLFNESRLKDRMSIWTGTRSCAVFQLYACRLAIFETEHQVWKLLPCVHRIQLYARRFKLLFGASSFTAQFVKPCFKVGATVTSSIVCCQFASKHVQLDGLTGITQSPAKKMDFRKFFSQSQSPL